jgi:uncharacterized protein YidB (DUF937 family)
MMDLMKIAAQLFMNKLGANGADMNESSVVSALTALLPSKGGNLDLGGLLGQLNGGGLASLAASWLGDGANSPLSASQLLSILGQGKVDSFAKSLNLNADTASQGLSGMLPELIDNHSKGGSLLDAVGGSDLLGSLAKNALGSLFK